MCSFVLGIAERRCQYEGSVFGGCANVEDSVEDSCWGFLSGDANMKDLHLVLPTSNLMGVAIWFVLEHRASASKQ
jgi:hypothetical protein